MGHLAHDRARTMTTPREWLPLGSQIAEQCNTWAGRNDIVAHVGKGSGGDQGTACWMPQIAEMEVNLEVAFGEGVKPEWVGDFRQRDTHYEHPAAAGAVLHEAMHARHTLFPLESFFDPRSEYSWAERKVAEYMEESRIEARAIKHDKSNRPFLRACALKIVLSELNLDELLEKNGVFGVATLLLLTLARVDAGVLEPEDTEAIRVIAEKLFGDEVLSQLRAIWCQAQAWSYDADAEGLLKLGREWVQLLKDSGVKTPADEKAEQESGASGAPGAPGGEGGGDAAPGGDDEGEPLPAEIRELIEAFITAVEEAAEEAEIEARGEAADQQRQEAWAKEVTERGSVAKEIKEGVDAAADMFGRGTGPSTSTTTSSRLKEKRPPTSKERAAAVRIGQMLDKARYQDRVVTPTKTALPPGRLNTRAAVQSVADYRRVGMTSQTPWRRDMRRHVEDPELKLGVVVDISGSMSSAMEPMAVTAWSFSEAARRIGARMAMVYYGSGVFPVLKPGQHLTEVNVYTAPDSTERFNTAAKAVNGALNLKHGSGARLLVIVSDMCYTDDQQRHAKRWVKELVEAGVAVVIMPFEARAHYTGAYERLGAKVIEGRLDPAAAAVEIGRACVEAIEKVSARRAG